MPDPAQPIERKLAAIFAADVAGYSRLMGEDEVGTLRRLAAHREIMDRLIGEHRGRIANTAGDSVLADFPSVVDAVQCAVEVQQALAEANEGVPENRRMSFRIGVHVGDVMVRGGDLFGEGVNIAARLQSIAEPGALCVSGVAYDYVKQSVPFTFYDLGPQGVKNIDQPVRAYATRLGGTGRTVELKSLPLPDRPSIAVLPFANMSGDPEQEYFADGVVEEIVTALSHIKWLFVIAPTSSFTYKGRAVDLKQIGRELGVRYILEGSLRKLGNRVRIAGQLIEAATGAHLWADRFDGELSNIFELQDEVAERVVGAIEPSLRSAEIERTRSKPTENLDAYDLYLRGQFELTQLSQETYVAAADLFRRAIALDPNYSDAHAALADSVGRSFAMGWIDDYEWARHETCQAARRAITSDPENATSLASAAWALALFEGHFDEALELADRAVRLHPNSAWVHTQAGFVHTYAGESDPAVAHFLIARRLSPVDPRGFITFVGLGVAHFVARRFEEAEKAARRGIAQMTRNTASRRLLAASLAHLGRVEEAREVVKELLILQPKFTLSFTRRFPRYRPSWMPELLIDGLRKAGVPE
jgi:adenylate cyclase